MAKKHDKAKVNNAESVKHESSKKAEKEKVLLETIAQYASQVAIEKYKEEADKSRQKCKDNRLHNAKLLVKKYRWLKDYNENAVYDTAQLCSVQNNEIFEAMGLRLGENYQVGSIRNGVIVTRVIMEHVETMLKCYQEKCESSKKPEINRRWRVLWNMYISDDAMTAEEVCDKEHISKSMVYLDIDNACEELASLFFGLDLSELLI